MKTSAVHQYYALFTALVIGLFLARSYTAASTAFPDAEVVSVAPLFPSQAHPSITFDQTIIASPLLSSRQDKALLVVPVSNGVIAMLNPETGALDWEIMAPARKAPAVRSPLP